MGMDAVELVMNVEDEFGISIPDRDAERLRTVGELHDYVYGRVKDVPPGFCQSRATFYGLRRAVVAHLGVDRTAVRPATALATHLPMTGRRAVWESIGNAADVTLPALRPPTSVVLALMASVVLLLVAVPLTPWVAERTGLLAVGFAPLTGAVALVAASAVAWHRTATLFPDGCQTYRGLVRRVVAINGLGMADRRQSEAEVWESVVSIVSHQCAVPRERVTRGADILNDLGAG